MARPHAAGGRAILRVSGTVDISVRYGSLGSEVIAVVMDAARDLFVIIWRPWWVRWGLAPLLILVGWYALGSIDLDTGRWILRPVYFWSMFVLWIQCHDGDDQRFTKPAL